MININESTDEEKSPFEEVKPLIYSAKAIRGFSIFFSAIFGGVLLMQNLRDIDEKKEANKVLLYSILYTIVIISVLSFFDKVPSFVPLVFNIAGASFLVEYYYKKYFSNDDDYPKKNIWKPLIISILITIPFIAAFIYSIQNEV